MSKGNHLWRQIVLWTLAALLIAVGACIPQLSAMFSNRSLEVSVNMVKGTPETLMSFNKASYFQAMDIAQGAHATITLTQGASLSNEEAEGAAAQFFDTVCDPEGASGATLYVVPVLASSKENPDLSAILWECEWTYPDGTISKASLDDSSGAVVSFELSIGGFTDVASRPLERVISYFEGYCPAKVTSISSSSGELGVQEGMNAVMQPGFEDDSVTLTLEQVMDDGEVESKKVTIVDTGWYLTM